MKDKFILTYAKQCYENATKIALTKILLYLFTKSILKKKEDFFDRDVYGKYMGGYVACLGAEVFHVL